MTGTSAGTRSNRPLHRPLSKDCLLRPFDDCSAADAVSAECPACLPFAVAVRPDPDRALWPIGPCSGNQNGN